MRHVNIAHRLLSIKEFAFIYCTVYMGPRLSQCSISYISNSFPCSPAESNIPYMFELAYYAYLYANAVS